MIGMARKIKQSAEIRGGGSYDQADEALLRFAQMAKRGPPGVESRAYHVARTLRGRGEPEEDAKAQKAIDYLMNMSARKKAGEALDEYQLVAAPNRLLEEQRELQENLIANQAVKPESGLASIRAAISPMSIKGKKKAVPPPRVDGGVLDLSEPEVPKKEVVLDLSDSAYNRAVDMMGSTYQKVMKPKKPKKTYEIELDVGDKDLEIEPSTRYKMEQKIKSAVSNLSVPSVSIPEINLPKMPDISMPKMPSMPDIPTPKLPKAPDMSGVSGSTVVAGIKAGAEVIDATANLTKEIGDAVDKARKTLHEISKENGALEVDLAENAKVVAEKVENKYKDLSHRRYWDGGKFSPNHLSLPRYGLTQDNMWKFENGQADKLSDAVLNKINKANDDLRKYTLKLHQVNENFLTRSQQRKLDAKKKELLAADFELRKAVELAKKAGLDMNYDDLLADTGDVAGFGPDDGGDQSVNKYYYPNPDMMAGLYFS